MEFKPGDICAFVDNEGYYGVLKILEIVQGSGDQAIYNVAVYQELFEEIPHEEEVEHLHPYIGHFPIEERYFLSSQPNRIRQKEVSQRELDGFREWFKRWQKGEAGIFQLPISECISSISQSLHDQNTFLH